MSCGVAGHVSMTGATGRAVVRGNVRVAAYGPPSAMGPAARCRSSSQHPRKVATWAYTKDICNTTTERAEGVSVGAISQTTDATASVWVRYAHISGGHSNGISALGKRDRLER